MHRNSGLLFQKYALPFFQPGMRVLEIGPDTMNSDYRKMLPAGVEYECTVLSNSVHWHPGMIPMKGEYSIECPSKSFDIVFSGQVAEHVRQVWTWLWEVARVSKRYVITICPVTWEFHAVPVDCWRIWPDGMCALHEYAGLKTVLATCENLDKTDADVRYNKGPVLDTIAIGEKMT